eukprot:1085488-Amphidinium_carterae.1
MGNDGRASARNSHNHDSAWSSKAGRVCNDHKNAARIHFELEHDCQLPQPRMHRCNHHPGSTSGLQLTTGASYYALFKRLG